MLCVTVGNLIVFLCCLVWVLLKLYVYTRVRWPVCRVFLLDILPSCLATLLQMVPAPCICIPWLTLVLKRLLSWWDCRVNDIFVCNNLPPGSLTSENEPCNAGFCCQFKELVYIVQLVFWLIEKGSEITPTLKLFVHHHDTQPCMHFFGGIYFF